MLDLDTLRLQTTVSVLISAHARARVEAVNARAAVPVRQEAEAKGRADRAPEAWADAAEWKLEVERVLAQLKVATRTEQKVTAQTRRRPDGCSSGDLRVCVCVRVCVCAAVEEPPGSDASTRRRHPLPDGRVLGV